MFQLVLVLRSTGHLQYLVNANYRVLICCTCHFQSSSLFFVYFGFLLLQVSSAYNFCPDTRGKKVVTYLGSLVQLCCGEGGTLQTNIAGMYGECLQCMDHTGFAPAHSGMCFLGLPCSGSTVLCKALSKAGPAFCALPRSKLLGLRFLGTPQGHRLGWVCVLCLSQV